MLTRWPTRAAIVRERRGETSRALAPRSVVERLIEALPAATAGLSLVGFVLAAYFRVTFAYPMWIMETPTMQAIRRIRHGAALYAPPSLDYVAPIYAPLYFYVSALVAQGVGTSLVAPRLVSMAASLGSAALLASLVWGETHRRLLSLLAAGLFVSTTNLSALSLDLARVDPLCLLLLLAAVTAARAAQRRPGRAVWLNLASGTLTGLAMLTKQTACVLAVPLLLIAVLDRRPRAALAYLLGVGVTTGLGALLLVVHDGSWVDFYLVQLPRRHSLALADLGLFWTRKILPGATLPLLLAPVFFIGRALRGERQLVRFWALAGAGLVGLSWAAMLNRWSDDNVLLPAFAVFAILAALGVDEVLRGLGQATRQARAWRMYAFVLLAVEFAVIGYNPRQTSPLRSDVWAADRLVSTVASLPGAVYGPDFAEYLYQAGKGDVALGLGILELEGGFGGAPLPQGSAWIAAYRAALDERRFDELLLDPESVEPFLADEAASSGYIDTGPLFPPNDVYWSWGGHLAPRPHVWLPRERAQ